MLPQKICFPSEDLKTEVGLGSPCRGVWRQNLDKEGQLATWEATQESLGSLTVLNHPQFKPGSH